MGSVAMVFEMDLTVYVTEPPLGDVKFGWPVVVMLRLLVSAEKVMLPGAVAVTVTVRVLPPFLLRSEMYVVLVENVPAAQPPVPPPPPPPTPLGTVLRRLVSAEKVRLPGAVAVTVTVRITFSADTN